MIIRKDLHNVVQNLKGNIRVFGRIRPLSETELKYKFNQVIKKVSPLKI